MARAFASDVTMQAELHPYRSSFNKTLRKTKFFYRPQKMRRKHSLASECIIDSSFRTKNKLLPTPPCALFTQSS